MTKMPLGMEVGHGPGNFVFDGDPAPPEKRHSPIQFLAMSTVANGWMPLGMEVNLGPGDVLLDGVTASQ